MAFEDFDWKSLEQFFGGQLPAAPAMKGDFSKWVEEYVQSVINETIREPEQRKQPDAGGDLPFDLFETDRSIAVKMKLPPRFAARNLNVRAGVNQLHIGGLPHGTQRIILPSVINNRRCRAQIKNGTLQITAPKTDKNNDFVSVLLPDD